MTGKANFRIFTRFDIRALITSLLRSFNNGSFTGNPMTVFQTGRVHPKSSNGTLWQVAPWLGVFYLPFWLDYVIIDVDPACELFHLILQRSPPTHSDCPAPAPR